MRIAIAGNFALTGNQTIATRAVPLARLLAARGHSVRMALPVRGPGDSPGVTVRDGVEICQVSAGLPGCPQCYPLQALRMLQLCVAWRPSVVYCFKPIAHSGVVLAFFLALRRLGLFRGRVVLDTDDWEGEGGWNRKQPFPGWAKRLLAWQEKWSMRNADAVVAASTELSRMARAVGAREVVYLPNCVEEGAPALREGSAGALRERLGLGDSPVVLVYTRFVEYRLERLLGTIRAILHRAPEARFIVAGSGLRGEEGDLSRMVEEAGLADRVDILGWVAADGLPDLFAAADLALYLLDYDLLNRTKCPMKLVDLASAGVPVVADGVGQAREYVAGGETGILVEPGDVEAMADGAARLLDDPNLRIRMGAEARARAERWRWPRWWPVLEKALGLSSS